MLPYDSHQAPLADCFVGSCTQKSYVCDSRKLTAAFAAKFAAGRAVAKFPAWGALAAARGALQGAGRLLQRRRHRVRRDVEVLAQVLDALVGQEPAAGGYTAGCQVASEGAGSQSGWSATA